MKYLMGIDNGGTVIKAALFDYYGNQIDVCSVKTPLNTPEQGYAERELTRIKEVNFSVIKHLTDKYGNDIAAIGLSGHGKGLYMLGKEKQEIYAGIGSTDNRAIAYEQLWKRDGTADKIYKKTAQKVMAAQPVCLLRWFKDNKKDIYNSIGYVMSVKDYIRYCLTGEINVEYTDISGTNLLNLYTNEYDTEILEYFGIEEMKNCLPEIKNSSDICGYITKECAMLTGLAEGTPVVAGMFDIDACAIAAGCNTSGDMCIIGGTWSINEFVSEKIVDDKTVSMNSVFCNPQYYLAEESSATSAGNLEWFRKYFKDDEYASIDKKVSEISASDCNVYYMPFLCASNENPLARGVMVGMTEYHTDAHIMRAVFEGVAFSHLTHINSLLKASKPTRIRLTGGVVNSAVWPQMFSDATGLEIEIVSNTEMGAKGAAMAAGVGAGIYKDYNDAANRCVRISEKLKPNIENHRIYSEKYKKYRMIVDALDKVWDTI